MGFFILYQSDIAFKIMVNLTNCDWIASRTILLPIRRLALAMTLQALIIV